MHTDLRTVGAVSAILTTAAFVVGIAFMATSGVQVLIPETGADGLDWIADVDNAGTPFLAGAWLVVLGGIFGLVALIGFYDVFRQEHRLMVLAPVLAIASMTLVTISHLIPVGMATQLVPAYVDAGPVGRASLEATFDTFAAVSLVLNYTGDVVLWGVVVPMFAYVVLKTRVVPHWIGWLGFGTALFAGWLGAFSYAVPAIEAISFVGFIGFFVWIAAMGIALLRRPAVTAGARPAMA